MSVTVPVTFNMDELRIAPSCGVVIRISGGIVSGRWTMEIVSSSSFVITAILVIGLIAMPLVSLPAWREAAMVLVARSMSVRVSFFSPATRAWLVSGFTAINVGFLLTPMVAVTESVERSMIEMLSSFSLVTMAVLLFLFTAI